MIKISAATEQEFIVEMVRGFPKHPKEKYLTITITGRNGSYSFAYDLVEGTPEFQKEF